VKVRRITIFQTAFEIYIIDKKYLNMHQNLHFFFFNDLDQKTKKKMDTCLKRYMEFKFLTFYNLDCA